MNTPVPKFGSTCEVSDKFIEKIAIKSGWCNGYGNEFNTVKENKEVKKTDGQKTKSIRAFRN